MIMKSSLFSWKTNSLQFISRRSNVQTDRGGAGATRTAAIIGTGLSKQRVSLEQVIQGPVCFFAFSYEKADSQTNTLRIESVF